jgi:hypothetical protein
LLLGKVDKQEIQRRNMVVAAPVALAILAKGMAQVQAVVAIRESLVETLLS